MEREALAARCFSWNILRAVRLRPQGWAGAVTRASTCDVTDVIADSGEYSEETRVVLVMSEAATEDKRTDG